MGYFEGQFKDDDSGRKELLEELEARAADALKEDAVEKEEISAQEMERIRGRALETLQKRLAENPRTVKHSESMSLKLYPEMDSDLLKGKLEGATVVGIVRRSHDWSSNKPEDEASVSIGTLALGTHPVYVDYEIGTSGTLPCRLRLTRMMASRSEWSQKTWKS